tara:strand:+ start:10454 stop:11797 length:1344 start_codon:yes stop_codon:yes gene_type:complete
MTSRYVEIRPDNIPANNKVSFKNGFPVISFTIQAQQGILDPRTIRICGDLKVFKDNLADPTPILPADTNQVSMDNRLGIFGVMEQVIIRHNKSKMVCEHIRHYNKMLQSYLGVSSSKCDLLTHLNSSALCMPNADAFFQSVVCNNATGTQKKEFSAHLPTGFMMSGNMVNLMPDAFGGLQIEIHLESDANCLFSRVGSTTAPSNVADAHYVLENLKLTCEIADIPADQVSSMSQQSGAMEFNTITSLYTAINSANAQLQYSLGLSKVQSAFMTFCPSRNINTLTQNGLATTYPSNSDNSLVHFNRIQFLRGGVKYPMDFDITTNASISENAGTLLADSQLAKQFVSAIIPEKATDRSSVSVVNLNRDYTMDITSADVPKYSEIADGGALFGVGVRYSQFNGGQDFKDQQFGVSLESDLTSDNPQSVFIFVKAKASLVYSPNGVQLIQ